jgi:imidazolonepropionase-like amidohydrolase
VNGAKLLGIEANAGSVEAGKQADLIAVSGDPLEDVAVLQRVQWVMQNGVVVHSSDRPLAIRQ